MAAIKSKNTLPEIFIRKQLYNHGFRYRINYNKLPGKPDIYLSKYNTAIFINGCFWHQHSGCKQAYDKAITTPSNNSLLGEYFRNRLGVPNGAPVTKNDLLQYGRTDVTFYKIDDEQFYMDFSTN